MRDFEYKVSVYVPCYNQKDFIRKNLDSILSQKVNFKYEVIVRDDCSTDGTREIIQEYAEKYPDIIKPYFEEENQFQKHNFMPTMHKIFSICKGEYYAGLEGDDYWCDENKLQTQIDFLDKNQDYTGCFTKTLRKNVITNEDICYLPKKEDLQCKDAFTIEDTICGYFISTPSVVYRLGKYKNKLLNAFPSDIMNFDSYLIYYFSLQGKIKYIDKLMAVHTFNNSGIWNSLKQSQDERNIKYWLEIINFPIEVRKLLDKFNCSLPYETPQQAMKRVLDSAINLKRYDIVEKAVQRFPEVFKTLITPIDKSAEVNYYRCEFKKYKKRNIALIIISTLLALLSIVLFLT